MKTLAQSMKRVVMPDLVIDPTIRAYLHTGVYADAGGALQRTKIKELSAYISSSSVVPAAGYFPVLVGVMSVKKYDEVARGEGMILSDAMANSVYVVSVDAVRGGAAGDLVVSVNSNMNQDIVVPFSEYDALTCGKDFYVWCTGGIFTGNIRVTVDVERVEITQDEYMKYYAGGC